jgi:hypothetical protein
VATTDGILKKVSAIEDEMRRIGVWSDVAPLALDETKLYAGISFE